MTKMSQKPLKWPKYHWNLKNDQNTIKTSKITKIPSKPLKITKIHSKPRKWPKYSQNLLNDKDNPKPKILLK